MNDNGAGTEQSGVELEPCPFCGGEATFVDAGSGLNYYVGCADDSCCGFAEVGWAFKTREEAVAAWNTRAERTCRIVVEERTEYRYEDPPEVVEVYVCSECGTEYPWKFGPYCDMCGAKVKGE